MSVTCSDVSQKHVTLDAGTGCWVHIGYPLSDDGPTDSLRCQDPGMSLTYFNL